MVSLIKRGMSMKSTERQNKLKTDILTAVFEKPAQSLSAIANAVGVSRPTLVGTVDRLLKDGILCIDINGRFSISEAYCFVMLKIYPKSAQLITVFGSDKRVERIELKAVDSMSESDNAARFAGIAERHIDNLKNSKKTVLAAVIADGEELVLPKNLGNVLKGRELVQKCLSKEPKSVLYLSANSPCSYIYFGDESVGCGKGIEKLDRGTIERAFDVMIPDLLAIDGFYTLCRDSLDPIKALCSRTGVQLRGNERDELSIDELGALRCIFERYCEKIL